MNQWGGVAAVSGGALIAVEKMRLYDDLSQGEILFLTPPPLLLGSAGLVGGGKPWKGDKSGTCHRVYCRVHPSTK